MAQAEEPQCLPTSKRQDFCLSSGAALRGVPCCRCSCLPAGLVCLIIFLTCSFNPAHHLGMTKQSAAYLKTGLRILLSAWARARKRWTPIDRARISGLSRVGSWHVAVPQVCVAFCSCDESIHPLIVEIQHLAPSCSPAVPEWRAIVLSKPVSELVGGICPLDHHTK